MRLAANLSKKNWPFILSLWLFFVYLPATVKRGKQQYVFFMYFYAQKRSAYLLFEHRKNMTLKFGTLFVCHWPIFKLAWLLHAFADQFSTSRLPWQNDAFVILKRHMSRCRHCSFVKRFCLLMMSESVAHHVKNVMVLSCIPAVLGRVFIHGQHF